MSFAHGIFLKLRMYRHLRWKYKNKFVKRGSFYLKGHRYCMRCRKFFKTEQKFCPVCNKLLRWSPRDGEFRRRYNKEKQVKYIVPPDEFL